MPVVVITPPAPIVMPPAISAEYPANDAAVLSLIKAATEELEARVRSSFGPQTLELRLDGRRSFADCVIRLPSPPLIDIVSVKWVDDAGDEQTLPTDRYRLTADRRGVSPARSQSWPFNWGNAVAVQYRAGYDGTTTGALPERVRQAIILRVRHMIAAGTDNPFLRSETVDGVGSQTFAVSEAAGNVTERAITNLLRGLENPSV